VGVNGYSQIVGNYVDIQGVTHGFVYNYENSTGVGTCIPIGLPNYSSVYAINNQGQILGYSAGAVPWLLDNGVFYSLPYYSPQWSNFYPVAYDSPYVPLGGINDAGQVVGTFGGNGVPCPNGFSYCSLMLNPE
jgi:hypothetical protein